MDSYEDVRRTQQEENRRKREEMHKTINEKVRAALASNGIAYEANEKLGWTRVQVADGYGVIIQPSRRGYAEFPSRVEVRLDSYTANFRPSLYPLDETLDFNRAKMVERVQAGVQALKDYLGHCAAKDKAYEKARLLREQMNAELTALGTSSYTVCDTLERIGTLDESKNQGLYKGKISFSSLTVSEIETIKAYIRGYEDRTSRP